MLLITIAKMTMTKNKIMAITTMTITMNIIMGVTVVYCEFVIAITRRAMIIILLNMNNDEKAQKETVEENK